MCLRPLKFGEKIQVNDKFRLAINRRFVVATATIGKEFESGMPMYYRRLGACDCNEIICGDSKKDREIIRALHKGSSAKKEIRGKQKYGYTLDDSWN